MKSCLQFCCNFARKVTQNIAINSATALFVVMQKISCEVLIKSLQKVEL